MSQSTQTSESDNGPKLPLPKLAYSPQEAVDVLGICQDTVYRLLKRGLLRSSSALRTKLIPHSELERFLRETISPEVSK